jgi:hydroxymethylglutaryl-CoA synthase
MEMTDLAAARGVDPAKYTAGIGQKQMSVASPCEDTVVLAAGAGQRLMRNFNIDPQSIAMLIVGTETGVDHSKPVASYVHQILGLPSRCRVSEVKHACYGAMIGLTTAINYILSGKAKGRKVLVIASDIARYGKDTAGEPTQGAGAVAMLISDQPALLEIDYRHDGFFATQVMDFWRPLYSKEAFADGHFSIQCYLDALSGAYDMYKENVLEDANKEEQLSPQHKFSERYDACLYHVPFVKMAQKAHMRLIEIDAGTSIEKDSPEAKSAAADFANRVAPALDLNARVGNIYTGALFLSLAYLLETSGERLTDKQICLFSYGSGCGAEFMGAKIVKGAASLMKKESYQDILNRRKQVSVKQYEEMLDACGKMDLNGESICDPKRWGLSRSVLYLGTKDHKRVYTVNGKVLG